jgi:hypothetical protein
VASECTVCVENESVCERERGREERKEAGTSHSVHPAVEEIGAEPTRSRGGRVGDECGAMEVNTTGEGVFRG